MELSFGNGSFRTGDRRSVERQAGEKYWLTESILYKTRLVLSASPWNTPHDLSLAKTTGSREASRRKRMTKMKMLTLLIALLSFRASAADFSALASLEGFFLGRVNDTLILGHPHPSWFGRGIRNDCFLLGQLIPLYEGQARYRFILERPDVAALGFDSSYPARGTPENSIAELVDNQFEGFATELELAAAYCGHGRPRFAIAPGMSDEEAEAAYQRHLSRVPTTDEAFSEQIRLAGIEVIRLFFILYANNDPQSLLRWSLGYSRAFGVPYSQLRATLEEFTSVTLPRMEQLAPATESPQESSE